MGGFTAPARPPQKLADNWRICLATAVFNPMDAENTYASLRLRKRQIHKRDVTRGWYSRAMPAYEDPPATPVGPLFMVKGFVRVRGMARKARRRWGNGRCPLWLGKSMRF